jgi:hypothetical protein
MLLSKPELKAFFISAIRHRKYKDSILVSKKQFSEAFRQWRWSQGIVFRKYPGTIDKKNVSGIAYSSLDDWQGNLKSVIFNCRKYFQIIPPKTHMETGTFRASGGKKIAWPDNTEGYKDIQDFHSWHRLYWLLNSDIDQATRHLGLWFDKESDEVLLHPYTTSERICNLCQFIAVSSLPDDLQNKIINQIYKDANWLYDHIETHLGIHNHLLNNARALCVAAYVFENDKYSKLWLEKARNIWDELFPKLILEDGFFSEQSTVYHVLLTRTLLEYLADAKLSKRTLPETFRVKAKKMCVITNLLIRSDGTMPIFGDASPDMPTEWLRGLTNICEGMGLLDGPVRDAVLLGYAGGASLSTKLVAASYRKKPLKLASESNWYYSFFNDSGFLFARNNRMNLELTAMGYPRKELHGHCDTGRGSYEIWWKGRHIVVDGGIPEYGLTPKAVSFKGPQGQNCISVDGLSPTLLGYEAEQLPKWYTKLQELGEWKVSSGKAIFKWYGFYRYKHGLIWRRTWTWDDHTITVLDKISGIKGRKNIKAYLHFGEKNWAISNKGSIEGENCNLHIKTSGHAKIELKKMQHSPNYGVIRDSLGVIVSGKVRLPFELEWKFDFSD